MGQLTFAERIRERYPEGLTGVFAIGGTRTTYALERARTKHDPGHIEDFVQYLDYIFERFFKLLGVYFELGGQNVINPLFSHVLGERGPEYAREAAHMLLRLIEPRQIEQLEKYEVDPYFAGIDTLLHLPEGCYEREVGERLADFQRNWHYQEGRRKLIWEVLSIPLYSMWNAHRVMGEEAQAQLEEELLAVTDLQAMPDPLYRYYARAVYGTVIPRPHFYLAGNRNGDLKLNAWLHLAFLGNDSSAMRLFFTPYPVLYITRETLQTILEDLAFGKPFTSRDKDYSGQFTPELAEKEYQRVMELAADPRSTLGLIRQVQPTQED